MWSSFLQAKRNRIELFLTVILLAVILFLYTRFLNFIEARPGVILNDPLLNLFSPADLTWGIFALIYISLFTALFFLIRNPFKLLLALQSYIVMIVFRIAAMYLLPLEPPVGMIALSDPFVEIFGTGKMLSKDLFFSGHTATLFILFLTAANKKAKAVFLICTIGVAVCVLLQHVHYALDVFAAPFIAYASFVIAARFRKLSGSPVL